ncbi:MAG: hypothetical protein ICV73_21005, partial [Acetobacteraceae bacterium]|nr:hypothetical protein [Acetobacteraceae bacterium]
MRALLLLLPLLLGWPAAAQNLPACEAAVTGGGGGPPARWVEEPDPASPATRALTEA